MEARPPVPSSSWQQPHREPGPEEQVQLASLTWEPARKWGDWTLDFSAPGLSGKSPRGVDADDKRESPTMRKKP